MTGDAALALAFALVVLAQAATPVERVPAYAKVEGRVTYAGVNPAVERSADPACARAPRHALEVAESGAAAGGLAGVRVVIRPAASSRHLPTLHGAVLEEEVRIDFRACRLTPAVATMMPGQALVLENRDDTTHALRAVAGTSLVFDRVLPRGARVELVPEVSPDTSIEARCRVHGETLSVLVHRHPYSAVTAADGSFEIDFVPDGEHLAEAWHPLLGRKTARVSVKGGRAAKLRFDFSGTRPPPAPR